MSFEVRNSDLKYNPMSDGEIFDLLTALEERFIDFLEISGYPSDLKYIVSRKDLIDTITRVDKREAYYFCFHNMEISEQKQVALYAYWILKFQPFTVTDDRYINNHDFRVTCINIDFAIYIICSILFYYFEEPFPETINKTFYKKLKYAFRYRNFSIESLMLLVEAITPETFELEYEEVV